MKKEEKIDLKQRITKADARSFNGWISFQTPALNEPQLNEAAYISSFLEKVGISLEVTRKEKPGENTAFDFVVIKVNEEKYKSAMGRHAGRKADFNEKYDRYGKCTVGELQEKLKTMTKTQVARELGCSRMTLYRILKNISLREPSNDISIWHYTS